MSAVAVAPWGPVERLLEAARNDQATMSAVFREIGIDQATDILLEEIASRLECPPLSEAARFRFELTLGDDRSVRILGVGGSGLTTIAGNADQDVDAIVRFDAVDLVESLFGPTARERHTSREVLWPYETASSAEGFEERIARYRRACLAVAALIAACATTSADLGRLSVRYGSDKWASYHWYTEHYQHHFARLRDEPVRVLEIGIGGYQNTDDGGASLDMWQRYFRRGLVYGLDIFAKPHVRGPRIRTVRGDQSDPAFLDELGRSLGPFDVVIDDGSHVNEHVRTSFSALFRYVRPGGLYAIEDLQTAYWPEFGGDQSPLATDTSVAMLKCLIDGLHHPELHDGTPRPDTYTDRHVAGVHFYRNLVIIDKGLNAEQPLPPSIRQFFSADGEYRGGAIGLTR